MLMRIFVLFVAVISVHLIAASASAETCNQHRIFCDCYTGSGGEVMLMVKSIHPVTGAEKSLKWIQSFKFGLNGTEPCEIYREQCEEARVKCERAALREPRCRL